MENTRKFLESMGLPGGDLYSLPTSEKRFSDGGVTFYLTDREDVEYIPVKSDEPFPYLNRLNEGFFASRDGIPVVMWNPQPSHSP